MDYISVVGIAIGLAMDAFAVAVANGAVTKNIKKTEVFKISIFFGLFQLVMPLIGWLVGKIWADLIAMVGPWVAFILLLFIGGKMIIEYVKNRKNTDCPQKATVLSFKTITVLAIATSIDALATGVVMPSAVGANTNSLMFTAVTIIGVITFIISCAGVYLGKAFGYVISKYAELAGGIVLVGIGVKILLENLLA